MHKSPFFLHFQFFDHTGSALGFYRAFRHPEQIKAIAYMEAIVKPGRWSDFPKGRDVFFRALRSKDGERLILDENFFIEVVLPRSIIRKLSEPEMEAYRAPYYSRDARLPMLVWPRELPIEDEPADVVAIVNEYGQWLSKTLLPKLFIVAEPGSLLVGRAREFCRTWHNQHETSVKGIHFIQEDSPHENRERPSTLRKGAFGLITQADGKQNCALSARNLGVGCAQSSLFTSPIYRIPNDGDPRL